MAVTLRQRGKIWWLFCHYRGRRIQKSTGTTDKRIALRARRALEAQIAEGVDMFNRVEGTPSFEVYAQDWLTRQTPRLRPGTLTGYRQAIRETSKVLVPELLTEVTRMDARQVVQKLSKNEQGRLRDQKTLRNLVNVVHALFADALDAELVRHNPFRDQGRLIRSVVGYQQRTEDEEERKPSPYSRDEQERLLAVVERADAEFRRSTQHSLRADHLAILLGLRAGLRRGEILALQLGDFDLRAYRLQVRRRISRHKVGAVKSKTSRRVVPMTSALAESIREHMKRLAEQAIRDGRTPDHADPIFPAERLRADGTGTSGERNFVRRFRRYAKDANVKDRYQPIHQLRHTYASELLSAGVPPYWVSRWLGHADTRITEWVYAHWIPRLDEHRVVDLLEKGGTFASLTQAEGRIIALQ